MQNWISELTTAISDISTKLSADVTGTQTLKKIKRGLEKESLRITNEGSLAQTPHPHALGSALTHPNITTDYSEALIEFITPPFHNSQSTIDFLRNLHTFAYQNLADEQFWVNSMPCKMSDEASIPIAQYGHSNSARMKQIYRKGLGHRYGRLMQTIAGIHYNFSLPETFWTHYQALLNDQRPLQTFINDHYFRLIRNFQRYSWVPIYLFGASPAICDSFLKASANSKRQVTTPDALIRHLPDIQSSAKNDTLFLPHGTSLRMSSLGYHNSAQGDLKISYNSLADYTQSLERAIRTSSPLYEAIGMEQDGKPAQLNTNVLQIENEFYNSIRPKRTSKAGKRPTAALQEQGVEYIEIRLLDLNPYVFGGINEDTLHFMDIFLLFCLFADSPSLNDADQAVISQNLQSVVTQGRQHETTLINTQDRSQAYPIQECFSALVNALEPIAALLDSANCTTHFFQALKQEQEKMRFAELTPSHKIITSLEDERLSFFEFAMNQADKEKAYFLSQNLKPILKSTFERTSMLSHARQAQIEALEDVSFEDYMANYFTSYSTK